MENREFYMNIDGIDIRCKLDFPKEEKEKYPLFIVVHGFTGNMDEPHIEGTAKTLNDCGFATFRMDMFGHGKSGGEFRQHNLLLWIDEIIRVTEYMYDQPYIGDIYMAGHSQGGLAIIAAAGILSDFVKAIIPMSPAMSLGDKKKVDEVAGIDSAKKMTLDEIRVKGLPLRPSWFLVNRMLNIDGYVGAYKNPVLLIHGSNDTMIMPQCSIELDGKYSNSKLVLIEGADHGYHEHLPIVLDHIRKFVSKLN